MNTIKKPMNCPSARELMFDYIDGSLSPAEGGLLEGHIDSCESCRAELSERREMLRLVKLSEDRPPADFAARVLEKIEEEKPKKKIFFPSTKVLSLSSLAACAVILLAICLRGLIFSDNELGIYPDPTSKKINSEVIPSESFFSEGTNDSRPEVTSAPKANSAEYSYGINPNKSTGFYGITDSQSGGIEIKLGTVADKIEAVFSYSVDAAAPTAAIIAGPSSQLSDIAISHKTEFVTIDKEIYECRVFNDRCLEFAAKLISSFEENPLDLRAYIPTDVEISELRVVLIPD